MDGNTKIVDDRRFDIRRCQKVIYLFNENSQDAPVDFHLKMNIIDIQYVRINEIFEEFSRFIN